MKNTYGRKSLIILLEDTETHTPDHVVQRVKYNKTQEQMGKNGLKRKKQNLVTPSLLNIA